MYCTCAVPISQWGHGCMMGRHNDIWPIPSVFLLVHPLLFRIIWFFPYVREGNLCQWFLNTVRRPVFGLTVLDADNMATWPSVPHVEWWQIYTVLLKMLFKSLGFVDSTYLSGLVVPQARSCVALWSAGFSSSHDVKTVDVSSQSPLPGTERFSLLYSLGVMWDQIESLTSLCFQGN